MKQGSLLIYDKEINYACKLMEYLNQKQDFLLQAKVFTNFMDLKEHLEENKTDILLIGEEMDREQLDIKQIGHIVLLTEHSIVKEAGEYPFLYKFQSMEQIMKELIIYYGELGICIVKKVIPKEKDIKLIGVCSAFGGCGKTLFSLAMGQEFAKYKKVLYVGMEAISSFREEGIGKGNLSDLLYFIKEKKEGSLQGVERIVEKRGELDCIFSPDYYEDLNTIKEEDMIFFLREIEKTLLYDIVIFDIGFWNEVTFSWLEQMDFIYVPEFLNRTFLEKERCLLNSMKLLKKESLYEKAKFIKLPFDTMIYDGSYSIEKLEETEMGQYICKVIKNDFLL